MVGDKRKVLVMLAAPGVVEALGRRRTGDSWNLRVTSNTPSLRSLEIYIP